MKRLNVKKWVRKTGLAMPPMLDEIYCVLPNDVIECVSEVVRLKCQNCGAWKRKRDCPPFSPTLDNVRKILKRFKKLYVFIWKSDGSIAWREGFPKEKLVKKVGIGLKGTAMGVEVAIHNNMVRLRGYYQEKGEKVKCWIAGPCHKCRVCTLPTLGKCQKGVSMPSMESWGIDVYGLYEKLGVEYEHPVVNYVTCSSMLGVRKD